MVTWLALVQPSASQFAGVHPAYVAPHWRSVRPIRLNQAIRPNFHFAPVAAIPGAKYLASPT